MSVNGGASLAERTKILLDRTGYPHDIHPGQRRYGPKTNSSDPPREAEIFIGKIPKDCFEDELVPLLEGCGEIYDIRLMMVPHDPDSNKGFAFVRMTTRDAALECVSKLDKYAIRSGKELGVCISESNCRLFIAGIPKNKSRDEILNEFTTATKGVVDIVFYADPKDLNKNRGFCFVDFDSHGNASNCRKRILSTRLTVWNKSNLVCDWAIPQDEPDDEVMSKVKTLFIKHIADSVNQAKLEEVFGVYGKVEKVNRIKDYAFVFFETREGALSAQEGMNGFDLNGSHISVSLAKPAAKNKDITPKSGYRTGSGNEGYMGGQGRRPRGPPRGGPWGGPGYYDDWGYGPPPPPPPMHHPPYDYGPPGSDYYRGGPPMVSYPTSSMGRARSGGGSKRGGPGGNRRGRGGSRPEGTPTKPPGGGRDRDRDRDRDRSSRGRGLKSAPRGGGPAAASKAAYPPNPAPQPEYKQEWNAADYTAAGYASYPGYNSAAAPTWTEDYTSDTWQQPGKRPATAAATPDPKRAQYQATTSANQWAGQYQAPAAYPATPQTQQWPAQSWAPQQPAQAQPQDPAQATAWNYSTTWKQ